MLTIPKALYEWFEKRLRLIREGEGLAETPFEYIKQVG